MSLLTKAFVAFNGLLALYVYNSPMQGRYEQEDAAVRDGMREAADELKAGASEVLNFANMFGGVGRMFGRSKDRPSPRPAPQMSGYGAAPSTYPAAEPPPTSPYADAGARPSSPYAAAGRSPPDASQQSEWPSEDS